MPNTPNQVKSELVKLKEKEKQSYNALSALIDLLQGKQKHSHEYKPSVDFDHYKQSTLIRATRLNLNDTRNGKQHSPSSENQFNVMHYKRAILAASQPNYRNMAILAAKHNLTPRLLVKLLHLIKKSCIKQSKEAKILEKKLIQAESKMRDEIEQNNANNAVILPNELETAV